MILGEALGVKAVAARVRCSELLGARLILKMCRELATQLCEIGGDLLASGVESEEQDWVARKPGGVGFERNKFGNSGLDVIVGQELAPTPDPVS